MQGLLCLDLRSEEMEFVGGRAGRLEMERSMAAFGPDAFRVGGVGVMVRGRVGRRVAGEGTEMSMPELTGTFGAEFSMGDALGEGKGISQDGIVWIARGDDM